MTPEERATLRRLAEAGFALTPKQGLALLDELARVEKELGETMKAWREELEADRVELAALRAAVAELRAVLPPEPGR